MENSQDWIKLITFGFGLLVGWKLRAYLGMPPSARNLKDWFTLRQKLILVVRSDDPQLNTAKIASYCASASILAYETSKTQAPVSRLLWNLTGQPKVVLKSQCGYDFEQIRKDACKENICTSLISEAKNEEEKPVVLAVGPGPSGIIDRITGHLKLY